MKPFVEQICTYLAASSSGRFVFNNTSSANLKVGELQRGMNGVYAAESAGQTPDQYTAVEQHVIDFWASNASSAEAYDDLLTIYNIFHRNHDYQTSGFEVYYSQALSYPLDLDRDAEGSKVLRLSVLFIASNLNLIS